jgi:hypothetical protein
MRLWYEILTPVNYQVPYLDILDCILRNVKIIENWDEPLQLDIAGELIRDEWRDRADLPWTEHVNVRVSAALATLTWNTVVLPYSSLALHVSWDSTWTNSLDNPTGITLRNLADIIVQEGDEEYQLELGLDTVPGDFNQALANDDILQNTIHLRLRPLAGESHNDSVHECEWM